MLKNVMRNIAESEKVFMTLAAGGASMEMEFDEPEVLFEGGCYHIEDSSGLRLTVNPDDATVTREGDYYKIAGTSYEIYLDL